MISPDGEPPNLADFGGVLVSEPYSRFNSMDLFDRSRERLLAEQAPLAARMRPRSLEEFVGQEQILGPGRLLRRAIESDQLSSLIFYGPPGCGKTTLAQIIANTTRAHFTAINAVLAGVADIRRAVAAARERLGEARRTILFVDEVHRFNKSQQDALLPHVENGTVILIGATTENPYFEVNKTLLSRSRIFELRLLEAEHLESILLRALADPQRGYGKRAVRMEKIALAHLARVANGDARAALNALQLAVDTTPPNEEGEIRIDLGVAEESIQRKAVLYDKDGDVHFDTVSAFIKSLRGSDPDAALYWMARMIYAGEDPRFILRRMLIFASEDVGLADPGALAVVESAARAFDYVGMPEGRFPLAQACLYLATAPKSNSAMAFFDALATVEKERAEEVPIHLKDANRDAEDLGHGQGYLYPHAYRDHWVAQQYLPDELVGRVFYHPGEAGYESGIRDRVIRLREAQLAALKEGVAEHLGPYGDDPVTIDGTLLHAGSESAAPAGDAEWRLRSRSTLGEHLEVVRTRVFDLASIKRHHMVLDARAGTGLLTWEALRRAREGGVWCRVDTDVEARGLASQARNLPTLTAPVILNAPLEKLPQSIQAQDHGAVRFDRILGRNVLGRRVTKTEALAILGGLLAPQGRLVLAESVPARGERLFAGMDLSGLGESLARRVIEAEEAVYADPQDAMVNWDVPDLTAWCVEAGLSVIHRDLIARRVALPVGAPELDRWLGHTHYEGKIGRLLGTEAPAVRSYMEQRLAQEPLVRTVAVAFIVAEIR